MCRLAAYVGPPTPLSALLYDAPHSLSHQAHSPREMFRGRVNVDGTGVAWWPEHGDGASPLRYVSDNPPWSDPNLPGLSARLRAVMALAAIRNASPGVPYGVANVAPFTYDTLACAHNGSIGRFRESTGRELTGRLPDDLYSALDTVSDSLVVFLTVVKHLADNRGAGLAAALKRATTEILDVCAAADAAATLNVVIADGERLAAVRAARRTEGNNPMYLLEGGRRFPGGVVLASEPLDDDPAWQAIDDDSLVECSSEGVTVMRLDA